VLSTVSAALLLPLTLLLAGKYYEHGFLHMMCSWTLLDDHRLLWFFYVNYLFKFYELLDTVFLALKKKPLKFLHVYHHCATLILCFTQLEGRTAMVRFLILRSRSVNSFLRV
jgi:fatty acid elongase 3